MYRWISQKKLSSFLNPNIFTETRTQSSFGGVWPSYCNISTKIKFRSLRHSVVLGFRVTNTIVMTQSLLLWYLASEPQKQFSLRIEPKAVSFHGVVALVPATPSSKEKKRKTLGLVPFFSQTEFPSYRKRPHRESNSGYVYGVLTILCSLPDFKECAYQIWWKSDLLVFSIFRRTNTHTHSRTNTYINSANVLKIITASLFKYYFASCYLKSQIPGIQPEIEFKLNFNSNYIIRRIIYL